MVAAATWNSFLPTSINQFLVRSEYLRRFSDQRKDIDKIDTHRNDLQQQQQRQLQSQLEEQRQLIAEKTREDAKLASQAKKRKNMLAEIRKDKKNIKREMGRKLKAAKQLEDLISKLIEDERVKREREAKEKPETGSHATAQAGIFESRRGHLRWPVGTGKVTTHFGAQENPSLHTVTQNPGIDISVGAGSTVFSIADGEVSAIWWHRGPDTNRVPPHPEAQPQHRCAEPGISLLRRLGTGGLRPPRRRDRTLLETAQELDSRRRPRRNRQQPGWTDWPRRPGWTIRA